MATAAAVQPQSRPFRRSEGAITCFCTFSKQPSRSPCQPLLRDYTGRAMMPRHPLPGLPAMKRGLCQQR